MSQFAVRTSQQTKHEVLWLAETRRMRPETFHYISEMVTVWCAISRHGIIGPYFMEDDDGSRCNVNSVVSIKNS